MILTARDIHPFFIDWDVPLVSILFTCDIKWCNTKFPKKNIVSIRHVGLIPWGGWPAIQWLLNNQVLSSLNPIVNCAEITYWILICKLFQGQLLFTVTAYHGMTIYRPASPCNVNWHIHRLSNMDHTRLRKSPRILWEPSYHVWKVSENKLLLH